MTSILAVVHDLFPDRCHHHIRLVGGTVRDLLLGRESRDIDLVADLSHDELVALGFRPVTATSGAGIYFRFLRSCGKIEVTRIDSLNDLEQDLLRRDFTCNAIAMDLSGALIDPLEGEKDVMTGKLRPCTVLSFTLDPLRIFRAFRFEAEGWEMLPETDELISGRDWSGLFSAMPMERFGNEMLKALSYKAPERFFERMIRFGVGEEFLPELFRMAQIPAGPLEHHPEGDLFTHSVQVMRQVAVNCNDPLTRFCALFHDIGKLATDPALYPKHHGHDDAGFALAEMFCRRLCLPARYQKALAWISRLHGKANSWQGLRDATKVRMAEQAVKAGIVEILPLVAAADKPGGLLLTGWHDAVRVTGMNTPELGIDREKLVAMEPENRQAFILQKRVEALRSV